MYAKLGSCLCMVRGIGDHSIAKWKSHPLLVRTMRSEKGSATVTVALFGVSPNRWRGRFQSPSGAPRRVLPTRRRDADESGRDDRAPHLHSTALFRLSGLADESASRACVPPASERAVVCNTLGRRDACSTLDPQRYTGTNHTQRVSVAGKTGPQSYLIRRTVNDLGKFLFIFGLIIA